MKMASREFDKKSAAHAASTSTSGKAGQSLTKAHSAASVTETGRKVKDGKRLDAQIRELWRPRSDVQKAAALMRAQIIVAAHGPAPPMLPPGPAAECREASAEGERAEFIRLLTLHPEKIPSLRQVLSPDEGKAVAI